MAVHRDLTIEAGSTERWGFIWRRPPGPQTPDVPGDPYDLNSASARLQIRTKPLRSGVLLLELTEHTGDGLYLGGVTGYVVISLTPEQTASIKKRRAFYDLFITLSNGDVHKVMTGKIKIEQNVTAPATGVAPPVDLGGITSTEGVKWA